MILRTAVLYTSYKIVTDHRITSTHSNSQALLSSSFKTQAAGAHTRSQHRHRHLGQLAQQQAHSRLANSEPRHMNLPGKSTVLDIIFICS